MTKWFHKCDLNWLRVRQDYLTATNVKDLLPFTKTGRKRTITDEHYFKVLSSKLVYLNEADCVSTGAAARGHILEPYALDEYNKVDFGSNTWLYHWDDALITKPNPHFYNLAFSPDAMSVKQHTMPAAITADDSRIDEFTTIGEVKSYSPERHLVAGYTPKRKLEERWQVATAMAVAEQVKEAYLLFYNPSMRDRLYIVDYDRTDLSNEISTVLEVEDNWLKWVHGIAALDKHFTVYGDYYEEEKIVDSIMKAEELNPEGEKSAVK